ncbi:iron-sulfur cluster repair di-iron protein [Aureisphaera sp. CAU 1614]|uniref:Iron-sulfur cluster repair di-iron protein n=1 Tax=Halomarinibacterium sedimenti TaxID=2857106 RepID=A0A9X1FPH4_9FLAO|nr:iron-sulfur cluster repair di-iron protein [Halomarinibacterium sedimenti]MBW2938032.1 iron-sulfur cluster repair di-iron protein [Halomarinibacterium sedimenti]
MNTQENKIIGELVAQDYRTASIFKKYGIDFCCQGNRTINEACKKKKIDSQKVLEEIDMLTQTSTESSIDYLSWPLDLITDYIEKKHHRYVAEKTNEIIPFLDKVCKVHGAHNPELFEISQHFKSSAQELAKHMKKEELLLFPFIRKMEKATQENNSLESPLFGTVLNPINKMMLEHSSEGERFLKIQELTNNYTPPPHACNTYKVTFALLKEFEEDLHLHIHLENNILFPRAIKLEQELNHVSTY